MHAAAGRMPAEGSLIYRVSSDIAVSAMIISPRGGVLIALSAYSLRALASVDRVGSYFLYDGAVIPGNDVQAKGTLTITVNPSNNDTFTIGTRTYRFRTTLQQADDIKLGTSLNSTIRSASRAINRTGTPGTDYHLDTIKNLQVSSYSSGSRFFALAALAPGPAGNSIATTETGSNMSFASATLTEGAGGIQFPISILSNTTYGSNNFKIPYCGIPFDHGMVVVASTGADNLLVRSIDLSLFSAIFINT